MNYEIERELRKWEDRVIYQVKFKENTTANLTLLNELISKKSLANFITIATSSEALVYKIGRHFISQNIKNEQITFVDGIIVESYINNESPEWKKKEELEKYFFSGLNEDFNGKWVFIPNLKCKMSINLAIYFIMGFKRSKALGLVFYSDGPDSLAEIISYNIKDPDFYEFPKKRYRTKVYQLPDDEY